MSDNAKLKGLAEAANAVAGDVSVEMTLSSDQGPNQEEIDAVTAFMGMATPAAVLALIAENERLVKQWGDRPAYRTPEYESKRDAMWRRAHMVATSKGYDHISMAIAAAPSACADCMGCGGEWQGEGIPNSVCETCKGSRGKALEEERDQLRAEIAGLKTGYEAYEQVVQGLKAENERHRAYADKCESAAAEFSRQLQTALIELKALQGEKAAQGEIRKERQAKGIEKARAEGKYQGRPIGADLHARVIDLLQNGHGVRPTARLAECSTTTVIRIKAAMSKGEQP